VVVTVFPSLNDVTQVFTLLAVVQVGPLVTLDGAAVVVVVVSQTPFPAVTLQ
jgi:hypothetical protein